MRAGTCSTPLYVPVGASNKIKPTHVLSSYYPVLCGALGDNDRVTVAEARTVLCSPKVLSSRLLAQQAAFISRRLSSRSFPAISPAGPPIHHTGCSLSLSSGTLLAGTPGRQGKSFFIMLYSRVLYCPAWLLSFATRLEPHTPHCSMTQSFRPTPRNAAVEQRQQRER